jgi:chromosomal replication initiation ATPase DnaA
MARPLLIETIRVVDGHRTQDSVYFLKQHTNLSLAEIAVIFGKSSSADSKIFQRVKGKISNKIRSQMHLK